MAIETFDLGSVPENETPALPGTDLAMVQRLTYRAMLSRLFPDTPEAPADFYIRRSSTIVAYYHPDGAEWAQRVNVHVPVWWDDIARAELVTRMEAVRRLRT